MAVFLVYCTYKALRDCKTKCQEFQVQKIMFWLLIAKKKVARQSFLQMIDNNVAFVISFYILYICNFLSWQLMTCIVCSDVFPLSINFFRNRRSGSCDQIHYTVQWRTQVLAMAYALPILGQFLTSFDNLSNKDKKVNVFAYFQKYPQKSARNPFDNGNGWQQLLKTKFYQQNID